MSSRLLLIIAGLWVYTTYKVCQMYPLHCFAAGLFTVLLFVVMIQWLFIYRSSPEVVEKRWFLGLTWIGSLTMGVWTTFILLSIPVDLGFVLYHLMTFVNKSFLQSPEKITLLTQRIDFFILAISFGFAGIGLIQAIREPRVKSIAIPISNLPQALHELKIAQISDLHVGPTIRKEYVERVVQRTNATNPDLIFVTGDLADAKSDSITSHLQPLAQLKSRLGIFYITGNHEYYWNVEDWLVTVKELGFIALINENRVIDINGIPVLIAGVTDHVGGDFIPEHQPDLPKAVESSEVTEFNILLAHRPDVCFAAEEQGIHLQFSGHTHGGQFFPFNMLLPLVYKYYRRLNKIGNLWLYVNQGTGYWGPANRFGVPAEITLVTLEKDN